MRVAGLIGVRMKSTRLHEKALADIEGKTLISHLLERVRTAKQLDSVIICTSTNKDDSILEEIARKEGVKCFKGDEEDVIGRLIGAAEEDGADMIVRMTGDNPLTDPEYIDRTVEHAKETGAEYTYVEGLPIGTYVEAITLEAMKKAHDLITNMEGSEYLTIYFRSTDLFNTEKIIAGNDVNRPGYRLTVDTPDDLELVRKIYRRFYRGRGVFTLKEAVKFLDDNPELAKGNSGIKQIWPEVKIREVDGKKKVDIIFQKG